MELSDQLEGELQAACEELGMSRQGLIRRGLKLAIDDCRERLTQRKPEVWVHPNSTITSLARARSLAVECPAIPGLEGGRSKAPAPLASGGGSPHATVGDGNPNQMHIEFDSPQAEATQPSPTVRVLNLAGSTLYSLADVCAAYRVNVHDLVEELNSDPVIEDGIEYIDGDGVAEARGMCTDFKLADSVSDYISMI